MEHRPTLRTERAGPPLSATGSSSTVHDSELRFRALVSTSSTTLYRMSPDWTQMHELTGQGFLEETAQPCRSWIEKYIPDADRTQVLPAVEQAIRTQSVFELEHRVLLVDGSFGWTHSRAVPIFDQSGELIEWFGAASDLTERHRSQARLDESEAAFELLANTMPQLAWVCDALGSVVFVNNRWQDYFGAAVDGAGNGLMTHAGVHPEDVGKTVQDFALARASGQDFTTEHRLCGQNGTYRWFMVRATPYREPHSGQILRWYGTSIDVHDRHDAEDQLRNFNEQLEVEVQARSRDLLAAEAQLRQMQKLEAIGQLTGGVAHDFNNILTIIRNAAELLRRNPGAGDKQHRFIDLILETADRATKLTGQLLAFARRQTLKPETFLAAQRVQQIAEMLRSMVGANIRIELSLPEQDHYVNTDPNQFETALVNLVINARDAMQGAGDITLAVSAAPALSSPASAPTVIISVTDQGHGIDAANLERVFEPFFTTKAVGKGTGLGLSQVYGFVNQSGGQVSVESELGTGTTMRIALPAATPPPPSQQEIAVPLAVNDAQVLLVEDNAQVGEITVSLLQELGYKTQLVSSAAAAIELLQDRHPSVDVVLSDVVMPGMTGLELADVISERWPGLPVVLASGYSSALSQGSQRHPQLLKKPYAIDDLLKALNRALHR